MRLGLLLKHVQQMIDFYGEDQQINVARIHHFIDRGGTPQVKAELVKPKKKTAAKTAAKKTKEKTDDKEK